MIPARGTCARLAALMALAALLGCSVNGAGLVRAERHDIGDATVHTTRAFGLHLDTRETGPSLTFGLYRSARVYPKGCAGRAALIHFYVAGLHLRAGGQEIGLTLGLRQYLQSLPAGRAYHLAFAPRDPQATRFRWARGADCQSTEERL